MVERLLIHVFVIGLWCNGSTEDFGSSDSGSNPDSLVVFLLCKFLRKDVMMMDYMIVNPQKTLYIRTDGGQPVTCSKQNRQGFEYSKACNILAHLPKKLHKFHFRVEAIPEIGVSPSGKSSPIKHEKQPTPKYIKMPYEVSNEVQGWLDRVKECNGLAKDAASRKSELLSQLSNVDRELSNCLHEIELTGNMNACDGYKEYKRAKTILKRRRIIKDELSVVDSILTSNLQSMATDRIQKVVNGLGKRKFMIRDVDLDEIYIEG